MTVFAFLLSWVPSSLRRALCTALCAGFMLQGAWQAAWAERPSVEIPVVRVGYFHLAGYQEHEEDVYDGYGFDFLRLLERYANLRYEFVESDDTPVKAQQSVKSGWIDMVTLAFRSPEREKYFAYSHPIGTTYARLTVRQGDYRYGSTDPDCMDLNGLHIGVLKGSRLIDSLKRFADEQRFAYRLSYYQNWAELEDALQEGQIDAILSHSHRKLFNERPIARFDPQPFYAVVRKDHQALLDEINYGIDQMDANEGDWRHRLHYKHFIKPAIVALNFTQREQDYIADVIAGREKITVTAETDIDPYSFVKDGRLDGIIPDYFHHLMMMVGLPYEVVLPDSPTQYYEWLRNNHCDVFMAASFARYNRPQRAFGILSTPYLQMPIARVTRKSFTGAVRTVAAVNAERLARIDEIQGEDLQIVPASSRQAALKAVADGRADASYVYAHVAAKYINDNPAEDLTYTLLSHPVQQMAVYVSPRTNHALASIINKCIAADDNHYLDLFVSNHTQYATPQITVVEFLHQKPWVAVSVLLVLALAALFVCFRTAMSRNLQKMADERLAYAEHLKRSNETLKQAIAREEAANRAKREFLFNMTHDIRTPMNAVLGFASIAQRHLDDPAKTADYLHKIHQSGRVLLDLINNVLEMSRIENGKTEVREAPCDFAALLDSIGVSFENAFEKKRLTFTKHIVLAHPAYRLDATLMRQVLGNLVSNAVKYTPEGGRIELSVTENPAEKPGCVKLVMVVSDNGIGISKEFLPHLFEQFEREHNTTTTGVEGSGLGLAIVKKITDLLGGTIKYESRQGLGTTATMTLECRPIASQPAAPVPEADPAAFSGERVLLAEDNELNAEIAVEILKQAGLVCDRARDGVECVKRVSESPAGFYRAVLMDVQMPGMDGYQATKAIRALPPDLASIPIIAMTANAFEEDRRQALAAGMNDFVPKPFDVRVLLTALRRAVTPKA